MRTNWSRYVGTIGLVMIGGVIAYRTTQARERRRQLQAGEIRPLQGVFMEVSGQCVFAWSSTFASRMNRIPVVLVHGFGISSSYMVPTAERLATEFPVYAPDLPGHGRSSTPAAALDIPAMADALIQWMDAAQLDRVALVANSMGCQVAVEAAMRYPRRIDRLVLIGPTVDPHQATWHEKLWRFLMAGWYERVSLKWHVLKDYSRMGSRLVAELRLLLKHRIENCLPRISARTLLVRGENDPICPPRWLDEVAALLHVPGYLEIPRWGHALNYSAATELVEAIRPFLVAPSNEFPGKNLPETRRDWQPSRPRFGATIPRSGR